MTPAGVAIRPMRCALEMIEVAYKFIRWSMDLQIYVDTIIVVRCLPPTDLCWMLIDRLMVLRNYYHKSFRLSLYTRPVLPGLLVSMPHFDLVSSIIAHRHPLTSTMTVAQRCRKTKKESENRSSTIWLEFVKGRKMDPKSRWSGDTERGVGPYFPSSSASSAR